MSDQDRPAPDEAAFDDPAYEELRRLLAETRVTEPVPAHVAARLDETLGSLRHQRRADDARPPAQVLQLRRRLGRVLVAAAAVLALGAGTVGIVQSARHASTNADSAASRAESGDKAGGVSPSAPDDALQGDTQSLSGLVSTHRLTTAHFARDVTRAMRSLTPDQPASGTAPSETQDSSGSLDTRDSRTPYARGAVPPVTATPGALDSSAAKSALGSCAGPDVPGAVTLPATLDGTPVALVFRPPTTAAQVVEAWSCDGATRLATATVPLR